MYRVIEYVKRPKFNNWEGAIIEDEEGKRFITNGAGKWETRPERLETCVITNKIDIEKFIDRWNSHFFNGVLTLKKEENSRWTKTINLDI